MHFTKTLFRGCLFRETAHAQPYYFLLKGRLNATKKPVFNSSRMEDRLKTPYERAFYTPFKHV